MLAELSLLVRGRRSVLVLSEVSYCFSSATPMKSKLSQRCAPFNGLGDAEGAKHLFDDIGLSLGNSLDKRLRVIAKFCSVSSEARSGSINISMLDKLRKGRSKKE